MLVLYKNCVFLIKKDVQNAKNRDFRLCNFLDENINELMKLFDLLDVKGDNKSESEL